MAKSKSTKSGGTTNRKAKAEAGTLADKGKPIEAVSEAADGALGAGGKRGVTYKDNPDKPDPSSVSQIEEVEAPVGA